MESSNSNQPTTVVDPSEPGTAEEQKAAVELSATVENIVIDEDVVNIENVASSSEKGIDYDKLLDKFGCFPLTHELKEKVERLTEMKLHRFLRRGIFFCHRDLDLI